MVSGRARMVIDVAKLFMPVAGTLVEPAASKEKYLARRVLGVASIRRPPLADSLGEELERRRRRERQDHGLDHHRRASSSRRASAASQNASTNSRTSAK